MKKAAFLDRDGVIVPFDVDKYIQHPDQVTLIPGVGQAIHDLAQNGYLILVVSNQGGVAKGKLTEKMAWAIQARMADLLWETSGAVIHDVLYCFDHSELPSRMRKPNNGMFLELIVRHGIDPFESFMVGDSDTDIIPANGLGMTTYYVGDKIIDGGADYRMPSLVEVAAHVLGQESP